MVSRNEQEQLEHKESLRLPGGWQLPPLGIHQLLALAIVAVALWSVSLIWLTLQGGEQWVGTWQEQVQVHVYVDKKTNKSKGSARLEEIKRQLSEIEGVYQVRQVSEAESRVWMEEWLGGSNLNAQNFSQHLPDSLEVELSHPRIEGTLEAISLTALTHSAEVNEDEFKLVKAGDVLGSVQSLAWFATLILAMAMALIVSNTLRMILIARAEEVLLMRLMGAKEWFVRMPFILEGLALGGSAGFVAWVLTWPLIWFTYDWQSHLNIDLNGWVMFLPLIVGGAIVGGVGALIATAKSISPETEA